MTVITEVCGELPLLKSVERVASYPIVESGYNCANFYYSKVKNFNGIMGGTLGFAENSVATAVELSAPLVSKFKHPLSVVDSFVLKSLDAVEQNIPIVKDPPERMYSKTRSYVCNNVVQPVVKRADSVKQNSMSNAVKYGNFAAEKIDSVLNVADVYIDKYLPDAEDKIDAADSASFVDNSSRPQRTLSHVNHFSRKLQRRLTRRTIAEVEALKFQSAETLQSLIYLTKLLARDPTAFMDKAKDLWQHLSQDEDATQAPPQNLEQLIVLIVQKIARKFVQSTNYSRQQLALIPHTMSNSFYLICRQINTLCNSLIKMIHHDVPVNDVMAWARDQLLRTQIIVKTIHASVHQLLERLIIQGISKAISGKEGDVAEGGGLELNNLSSNGQECERNDSNATGTTDPNQENNNAEGIVNGEQSAQSSSSSQSNDRISSKASKENSNR